MTRRMQWESFVLACKLTGSRYVTVGRGAQLCTLELRMTRRAVLERLAGLWGQLSLDDIAREMGMSTDGLIARIEALPADASGDNPMPPPDDPWIATREHPQEGQDAFDLLVDQANGEEPVS